MFKELDNCVDEAIDMSKGVYLIIESDISIKIDEETIIDNLKFNSVSYDSVYNFAKDKIYNNKLADKPVEIFSNGIKYCINRKQIICLYEC